MNQDIPAIPLLQLPAALLGQVEPVQANLNLVWTLLAAALVMFMQLGFAMVECGFTRAKNAVNIIMKNLVDYAVGSLVFFFVGYGLMFGVTNGFCGTTGFALHGIQGGDATFTFMFFQTVFAATAATIVSGAVAERIRFHAYLVYSVVITLVIYPIFGSWAWGGLSGIEGNAGWLQELSTGPFCDFAGSTVVHSVGGWLALAGALVAGPRTGKYTADGKPRAIPGHNIPLAALGVFVLWFGWFGFNAGSTTTGTGDIGRIAVTTNLAAAAGAITALGTTWLVSRTSDISMTLNGALAGLVAITAGCATVTPIGAVIIGAIGGVLVVFGVNFLDRVLKVDDPVGAISVHALNGIWGTLACGLFNAEAAMAVGTRNTGLFYGGGGNQLISQLIGAGTACLWAFGAGLLLFVAIKKTIGLRVSVLEERRGLDIGEHGMEAYSGFQIFITD